MENAIAGDAPYDLESFFRRHLQSGSAWHVLVEDVVQSYLEWTSVTGSPVAPSLALFRFLQSKGSNRVNIDGKDHFSGLCWTRLSPRPANRWDDETKALAEHILALAPDDLPPALFEFCQGETVTDSDKFLTAFQHEIRCGEGHPRAGTGVLQEDMRILLRLLSSESTGHEQQG